MPSPICVGCILVFRICNSEYFFCYTRFLFLPAVNCVSTTLAGRCSKSCGSGTMVQTYKILTNGANGGVACTAANMSTSVVRCNTKPCRIKENKRKEKHFLRSFTKHGQGGDGAPAGRWQLYCIPTPSPLPCGCILSPRHWFNTLLAPTARSK